MSLLTIIQKACDRLSLARPSVVVTSTDQQVRQLFGLANEEGEDLSKRCNWQALTDEWSFVTNAAEPQTNSPLAPDLRNFIPNSFFNRTAGRRLLGPITPAQYQAMRAQPVYGLTFLTFRQRDGSFLITPAPGAGETIAYEYRSKYWAMSSANVGKAEFTSDDDGSFLDEELLVQGIRWRWKAAKGLDYAEDLRTYEINVQRAIGEDGGATALSIGGQEPNVPLERPNIPEGGFGL